MTEKSNLIKAVIKAMSEIENVEKNLNVGAGMTSYKGVADKDVKTQIRKIMIDNGLTIFPIEIDPKTTVSEWEEEQIYNGKTTKKHKIQVLTEVLTKYEIIHTSGESIIITGYGHGIDSQDKSAGKATTYALKYALLNTFLVPTGDIDDTDNVHSDDLPDKPKNYKKTTTTHDQESPKAMIATCKDCGSKMVKKSGVTNGRQWEAFFCPNAIKGKPGHEPIWL